MPEQPDIMLREIPGYENYQIGENGEVYSKLTGKELKKYLVQGYYKVTLYKIKSRKHFFSHRLLGSMFIENPHNKPLIDHINRVSIDNRLENLRWVSSSENNTNRNIQILNTSGFTGISTKIDGNRKCWYAHITKEGKAFSARFDFNGEGFEKAKTWRKQKEEELHKIL